MLSACADSVAEPPFFGGALAAPMGRLQLHLYIIQQNWSTIELKSTFLLCFKNLNLLYLNFLNEKNINYKFLNYLIQKKTFIFVEVDTKIGRPGAGAAKRGHSAILHDCRTVQTVV